MTRQTLAYIQSWRSIQHSREDILTGSSGTHRRKDWPNSHCVARRLRFQFDHFPTEQLRDSRLQLPFSLSRSIDPEPARSLASRLSLGVPSQVSSLLSDLVKDALNDPALGEITSLGFDLAISDTSGHLATVHQKKIQGRQRRDGERPHSGQTSHLLSLVIHSPSCFLGNGVIEVLHLVLGWVRLALGFGIHIVPTRRFGCDRKSFRSESRDCEQQTFELPAR